MILYYQHNHNLSLQTIRIDWSDQDKKQLQFVYQIYNYFRNDWHDPKPGYTIPRVLIRERYHRISRAEFLIGLL